MAEGRSSPMLPLGRILVDARFRRRVIQSLLTWFRRQQRDLPWRKDRDPYRIWVSEVMLQQTQASTVIRFFEPFIQRFPTIDALAAADEQDVLRCWEGLGYYRRARDLHRAARHLATYHQGRVPNEPSVMKELPGIGRYILGAVLSQAFDRRLPILEANSERIMCRLFGVQGDPRRAPVRSRLWQLAEALLPARHVGDFNQALMELGALVCTPSAPCCSVCPVARVCTAKRLALQEAIPVRSPPPDPIQVQEVAIVLRRGARVLLVQRPPQGRWAAMWEFPHGPLTRHETHEAAAVRLLAALTGLKGRLKPELLSLRHAVNHHHIALVCFEAGYQSGRFRSEFYVQGKWVEPRDLPAYPVSSPQRQLAQALIGAQQKKLF
jgi:A/G-specific adenine glycosylase